MIFETLTLLIDREPHGATLNMALDETLMRQIQQPLLRAYRWAAPSISFGYFERYAPVAAAFPRRDLVRRLTGGGVVPHGEDFTYSLLVPTGSAFFEKSAAESYAIVHRIVATVLREIGVNVALAESTQPRVSPHCFENAVPSDVLLGDRKIAGAAQRRTSLGLLHQGSIQQPGLELDVAKNLAAAFSATVAQRSLSAEEFALANELARTKYSTEAWQRKF